MTAPTTAADRLRELHAYAVEKGVPVVYLQTADLGAILSELERMREALREIGSVNRSRDQLQEIARAALSGTGSGGA